MKTRWVNGHKVKEVNAKNISIGDIVIRDYKFWIVDKIHYGSFRLIDYRKPYYGVWVNKSIFEKVVDVDKKLK